MTRVAQAHDAINLAQGFPDFPAPAALKEAAAIAIAQDHNQYPITWGVPAFRDAIATAAASLSAAGAGKSGNPWARLIAPCACATRVISRIADSANDDAFADACRLVTARAYREVTRACRPW